MYPALSRLERQGLLTSGLRASTRGAARKYYRVTDEGRSALTEARASWAALQSVVECVREQPAKECPDVPA